MELQEQSWSMILGALIGVVGTVVVGMANNLIGWLRLSRELTAQASEAEANRAAEEKRLERQLDRQREETRRTLDAQRQDLELQFEEQRRALLLDRQVQAIATVTGILQLAFEKAKNTYVRVISVVSGNEATDEHRDELYRDLRQHSITLPEELESLALVAWHRISEFQTQVLRETGARLNFEYFKQASREQKIHHAVEIADEVGHLDSLTEEQRKAVVAKKAFEAAAKRLVLGTVIID
jgi:hypothetical protein